MGLQLGEDRLRPADGSRCEGLDAFLGCIAHGLDMGVALLGGGIGGRHHAAGGADEGHVGHTVHHAGLQGGTDGLRRAGPETRGAMQFRSHSGPGKTAQLPPALHPRGCTSKELWGFAMCFLYLSWWLKCLNGHLIPKEGQAVTADKNLARPELRVYNWGRHTPSHLSFSIRVWFIPSSSMEFTQHTFHRLESAQIQRFLVYIRKVVQPLARPHSKLSHHSKKKA